MQVMKAKSLNEKAPDIKKKDYQKLLKVHVDKPSEKKELKIKHPTTEVLKNLII